MSDIHLWHGTPRRVIGECQAYVTELTYGRGRLCIGAADDLFHDIVY